MAHHGTGHTRFNRVMRRKYQLDSAYYSETGQNRENVHDTPATMSHETVVAGMKNDKILDSEMQKHEVYDSQELLEKRQQSDTATGDQTTVSATVINVVDNNSQTSSGTSATAPTTISDESTVPATTDLSTESDSFSLSLSATISVEVPLTASPAYSSPTADTPAVTSTPEPSSSAPPSSAPASSKTSTPLFGSTATSLPSSTSIKPSSTVSDSNTSGTQNASQVTASSSGVVFSYGSQSTTTSSVSQTSSATTSIFSSDPTSTDSYYGAWTTASNGGGGGLGGTATGQAASETSFSSGSSGSGTNSTSSSGSSSGSGSLSTQTKGKIAGGVVGGVAAAMFVFVFVVWLLRRRRRNILPASGDALPEPDTTGTAEGSIPRSAEMASRRSSNDPLFTASYFAPAFMKRWRQSHMTTRTDDSTLSSEPSERGFQKISGRKIPSVLQSGGDGYGGGFEPGSPTASEPSTIFSPSSPVQPRSPATQPPLTTPYGMPLDASYTREAEESGGMVVFRPSPARTPVTSASASLSNEPGAPRIVSQVIVPGALSPTMPKRPDALGRSHPSFDGSRGSRFTESI
ncbi:hypothetical protein BO94DRAFT_100769 [Aspergillus sclerotioniger CBS 115572]|uniref:Mid2 domain-containing protein n=1 Tax=Aspergillus sclerotioniger CBS 115572 TaxID=1450535 RepID=A0A317WEN3_9EURO|nr:hypothetical protein BO94DRAFT_100769 [Aspergillus sclerotioniger CBS 115572]PWY84485.1 hypothetical protein BO94DRAFT_100769 [Aspergillus sclerotioniger CBS 115572]